MYIEVGLPGKFPLTARVILIQISVSANGNAAARREPENVGLASFWPGGCIDVLREKTHIVLSMESFT